MEGTPCDPSGMPQDAVPRARYVPPQCGARCRDGHPCKAATMLWKNRCRMHGGASTGPRTPEGKAKALACLAVGRARRSQGAAVNG